MRTLARVASVFGPVLPELLEDFSSFQRCLEGFCRS